MRTSAQLPCSFSPCSVNLSLPASQPFVGIDFRLPGASVPDHDRAAAVFALRDHALERGVVERMILDLNGQRLHRWVEAGPLRHRPAFERAVVLQAEVVVQPAGGVLLNDELPASADFVSPPGGSGVFLKSRLRLYSLRVMWRYVWRDSSGDWCCRAAWRAAKGASANLRVSCGGVGRGLLVLLSLRGRFCSPLRRIARRSA